MRSAALLLLPLLACRAAPSAPSTDFAGATRRLEHLPGFFDVYLDRDRAQVKLAIPPESSCLWVEGLATGLGSNPVGLDRGQLGPARLLHMRRVGDKVLFEQPNLDFRALSSDPDEVRAARDSFATSVLWAGAVEAEDEAGRALVDVTSFVVRDAHGVAETLARTGQGSFALDPSRSLLDPDACLAFPDNLELEALLTFAGKDAGPHVRETAPAADSVTLVQHHSFIRLPDEGYRPRRHDPRSGSYALSFLDYAAPLEEDMDVRYTVRHRLQKRDPRAARSEVVEPIVYYVDRGAPEPVRSALVEGAGWWARAFEAAGFERAFEVELLPEGAHPLDARYNVIQWVHRSTRGWSYGGGIVDPRTGEMIKGHVTLGSLRVRQDRLLFEGLAGTEKTGTGAPDDPVQLALARIRQLAAHEVGHTLGFAHNFAASTYAGRASVMDYPAPLVGITDGALDFSEAYAVGIGAWDVHAVRWAYSEFAPGVDERAELERIVRAGIERGYLFLSDSDARPAGAAHPLANLWDNGSDPTGELGRVLGVRRFALERFGAHNLAAGIPLAHLEEVLAPLYFHHRYQLDAALKSVGGMTWRHALAGSSGALLEPVPGAEQRRALEAVLSVLAPEHLDLPERVLALLPPRPPGEGRNPELFAQETAPAFDALGAAATASDAVVAGLLQPERAARLFDSHRRDPTRPGLEEVLDALFAHAFLADPPPGARARAVVEVVQQRAIVGMLRLAGDAGTPLHVRQRVEGKLEEYQRALEHRAGQFLEERVQLAGLAREIERFRERERREERGPAPAEPPPPGSPIGSPGFADAGLAGCSFAGGAPASYPDRP